MSTFTFFNGGVGPAYDAPFSAPFKRTINIPSLITNGGLANTSNVAQTLPSTGFGAADVLQVFEVPEGFFASSVIVNPTTAEGATCTIDVGVTTSSQVLTGADTDGFINGGDINGTASFTTAVSDGFGATYFQGVLFITAGTVDIIFVDASTETAVFEIAMTGFQCY